MSISDTCFSWQAYLLTTYISQSGANAMRYARRRRRTLRHEKSPWHKGFAAGTTQANGSDLQGSEHIRQPKWPATRPSVQSQQPWSSRTMGNSSTRQEGYRSEKRTAHLQP